MAMEKKEVQFGVFTVIDNGDGSFDLRTKTGYTWRIDQYVHAIDLENAATFIRRGVHPKDD